jgi:Ran GTPase-activating protein (RanGAP) involved in mRNA processing and transport
MKGAVAIGEALRDHGSLTELDLSGNAIGHDGAARLAYVMQRNPKLKKWCVF